MDCRKVREELVFLLTEEMDRDVETAFSDHVARCPHCYERAVAVRRFLAIFRGQTMRCNAPRRLREKILAVLPHRRITVR